MEAEPRELLRRLIAGEDLARNEAAGLVGALMDGGVEEALQAALLVALAMKGETVAELTGAAEAMRRRVVPIPHHRRGLVDTCGTGGDAKGTFNISTAAALVAAGAGVAVAKHGNRSVSSRSGSADVLEALGVEVGVAPERSARALDEVGLAFLFAPRHHPAMREVMPVRRMLGVRTVFNLLGPLTNPAGAPRQLLGVYAADRVRPMAEVLAALGSERAMVVHGSDGLDELTLSAPTRVVELRDGELEEYEVAPEEVGLERAPLAALAGGEPAENAAALRRVLEGEPGPLADVTALNAGAAIRVAGAAEELAEGVERARQAISSGAALAVLERLRSLG